MNLILASSSPYRAKQIEQIGLKPRLISPNIDESRKNGESAEALSLRLAVEKAQRVVKDVTQNKHTSEMPALVIGCDQTAGFNDRILGKPLSISKAQHQLSDMSGNQVTFFTSLALVHTDNNQTFTHTNKTVVTFRQLSENDIEQYVAREKPLDCAGSFKCEGLGIVLFESIQSDDPSALIGLPLIALTTGLLHFGINPLQNH